MTTRPTPSALSIGAALALLACALLSGCASRPAAPASSPQTDPANTVIVPDERGPLGQAIRQRLAERGWTLIGYDAAMLAGSENYARMARRARYRITLSGTRIGNCRGNQPSYVYSLAMIENHSGNAPLAMSGADCLDTLVQRFATQLDQKRLVPSYAAHTQAPAAQ